MMLLSVQKQKQIINSTQVIFAVLNEQEGIGLTIIEIIDELDNPHVLVVDGKSTGRTVEIAQIWVPRLLFKWKRQR